MRLRTLRCAWASTRGEHGLEGAIFATKVAPTLDNRRGFEIGIGICLETARLSARMGGILLEQDLSDRVCLVTGANAGIGYITARELARAGAHVILACRSEEKGLAAVAKVTEETGSEDVEFLKLDLADLSAVKESAEEFLASNRPLHLLVNNAGLAGHRGTTADGFEVQFGVNHLGPYLFTRLLMPAIESSAPARIVNVASRGHSRVSGINFDAVTRSTKTVAGFKEYCVSKLANVAFTMELAKRLPDGVTTYSLHPGVIKSEVWRRIPWPVRPLVTRNMLSVEEGAKTSLYCATEPGLEAQSGAYFSDSKPVEKNKAATEELALELWNRSEDWCRGHL